MNYLNGRWKQKKEDLFKNRIHKIDVLKKCVEFYASKANWTFEGDLSRQVSIVSDGYGAMANFQLIKGGLKARKCLELITRIDKDKQYQGSMSLKRKINDGHKVTININGVEYHNFNQEHLSYMQITNLANVNHNNNPSITYKSASNSGILNQHEELRLEDGIIINCYITGNA